MNELEKLNVDFSTGKLDDLWLNHFVESYSEAKQRFVEALGNACLAYQVKEDVVAAKTWNFPSHNPSPQELAEIYTEISKYIEENTSDSWNFSHIEEGEVDINDDPYDGFEYLVKSLTVMAYVTSENQVTTEEQTEAVEGVKMCLNDLMFAKKHLEEFVNKTAG